HMVNNYPRAEFNIVPRYPKTLGNGLVFASSAISSVQWVGVALFFLCNRQQHLIARDLAALRKGPDGSPSSHGVTLMC
ncbi:hypothetical protein ANCCEY_09206, partial [Ancylostoma ceylanicum]